MSNGGPRTQPTSCDALYYGLGRPRDLPAAYRCYGTDGDFQMQIIMAINGDGVRRSIRRIDKLFDQWERKDPGEALSGQNDPLRVALGSLRAGTTVAHVEFCKGVASGTLDGERCDSIRQFLREADTRQLLQEVSRNLSSPQRVALGQLSAAFNRFKEAEGGRGYQAFVTGSIRRSAGAAQEDYVREHFVSHVKAIVGQRTLAPRTDTTLVSAIATLDTVYQADLVTHLEEERDAIGIGEGYVAVAAKARQAWDEYRRAWMAMVKKLSLPNMGPTEAALAMETLLTVERVDELQYNILGTH